MKQLHSIAVFIIIIMFFIPVLSTEGATPWIIFIFFSYKILKTLRCHYLNKRDISKKILKYFIISIVLGISYNILTVIVTKFVLNCLT